MTLFKGFPTLFPSVFNKEFEDEFNNLLSGFEKFNRTNFAYPYDLYDLIKDNKKIATVIEIAAAGFSKNDCKISVKEDKLTLKFGKMNNEPESEYNDGEGVTRQYISKRIANRTAEISWKLAKDVDQKKISVKYTDGILKITLPIMQPEQPEENFIEIQ